MMNRQCESMLLAGTLLVSLVSVAEAQTADAASLLQSYKCYACHHETETLLGPPYRAIAARHTAGGEQVAEALAEKVILGGGGNWGVVPMVPNERVSRQDALTMARWILENR